MYFLVKRRHGHVWKVMRLRHLVCLLPLVVSPLVRATEPLEITLVSEVRSISPGEPFHVGLSLHHGPGYHTYWKHPGIVGVPTNIQWMNLPAGFKAEPIDWPEPEAVKMFQIKAQGYERDVVLPIKITPPAALSDGSTIKLTGKASWMCCNRECNPGFKDLSIELPVRKSDRPDYDAEWRAKFEAERALRPQFSSCWQASASSKDKRIVVTLKPRDGAAKITADAAKTIIYFTEDGLVDSDKPQGIEVLGDGSLRFSLVEAEFIVGERPAELCAVLLHPPGWLEGGKVRCLRIAAPLTTAP